MVDYELSREKNLVLSCYIKLVITACNEKPEYLQKSYKAHSLTFFKVYSQLHMQHDRLLVTKWDLKMKSEK